MGWLGVALLLLGVVHAARAAEPLSSGEEGEHVVPAFLWSDHVGIRGGHSVDYAASSAAAIGERILDSLDSAVPDLIFAFVGKHLQAVDVARLGAEEDGPLAALQSAVTGANSSRSFPYVSHGPSDPSMGAILVSAFERAAAGAGGDGERPLRAGQVAAVGQCRVHSSGTIFLTTLEETRDFLTSRSKSRAPGETDMLVVCSRAPFSLAGAGGLQADVEAFLKTYGEVRGLAPKHVAVFATDPTEARRAAAARRRLVLQKRQPDAPLCDAACRTKATLWETLFVAITLLIVLVSGLCCLIAVDTPDRFEVPKDA